MNKKTTKTTASKREDAMADCERDRRTVDDLLAGLTLCEKQTFYDLISVAEGLDEHIVHALDLLRINMVDQRALVPDWPECVELLEQLRWDLLDTAGSLAYFFGHIPHHKCRSRRSAKGADACCPRATE